MSEHGSSNSNGPDPLSRIEDRSAWCRRFNTGEGEWSRLSCRVALEEPAERVIAASLEELRGYAEMFGG